jgi:hypothetical protein
MCGITVTPQDGSPAKLVVTKQIVFAKSTTGGSALKINGLRRSDSAEITESVSDLITAAPTSLFLMNVGSEVYAMNVNYVRQVQSFGFGSTVSMVHPYGKYESSDSLATLTTRVEALCAGTGMGNALTRYVQQIENQATAEIEVTINGGVLPLADENVTLHSVTGPLFQGVGASQYTIDRGSVPNRLILASAPPVPLNFYMEAYVPTT